jgi:hypothetical protein
MRGRDIRVQTRGTGADGAAHAGPADNAIRFLRELRELRNAAGLEPAELAARAHYPPDVVTAAEAGPALPSLPVLTAYVRGCGGELAEWEERWRSVTGSPAEPALPARPAGSSSLAAAGARAASHGPAVGFAGPHRTLAAMSRAPGAASGTPDGPPATGLAAQPEAATTDDPGTPDGTPAQAPPASTPARPGGLPAVRRAPLMVRRQLGVPRLRTIAATVATVVLALGAVIVILLRKG